EGSPGSRGERVAGSVIALLAPLGGKSTGLVPPSQKGTGSLKTRVLSPFEGEGRAPLFQLDGIRLAATACRVGEAGRLGLFILLGEVLQLGVRRLGFEGVPKLGGRAALLGQGDLGWPPTSGRPAAHDGGRRRPLHGRQDADLHRPRRDLADAVVAFRVDRGAEELTLLRQEENLPCVEGGSLVADLARDDATGAPATAQEEKAQGNRQSQYQPGAERTGLLHHNSTTPLHCARRLLHGNGKEGEQGTPPAAALDRSLPLAIGRAGPSAARRDHVSTSAGREVLPGPPLPGAYEAEPVTFRLPVAAQGFAAR